MKRLTMLALVMASMGAPMAEAMPAGPGVAPERPTRDPSLAGRSNAAKHARPRSPGTRQARRRKAARRSR